MSDTIESLKKAHSPALYVLLSIIILTTLLSLLTGAVVLFNRPQSSAAGCEFSFSPNTVNVGGAVKVSILNGTPTNTFKAEISPSGIQNTRVGIGEISLVAPSTTGNYLVAAADATDNNLCALSSGSSTVLTVVENDLTMDSDGDGCTNGHELGSDWRKGGQRDHLNKWDVFDVPAPALSKSNVKGVKNKAVTLADAGAVQFYIGTKKGGGVNVNGVRYDDDWNQNGIADGEEYDRTPSSDPTQPWRSGPPNGAVSLQDVSVIKAQVGTDCTKAVVTPIYNLSATSSTNSVTLNWIPGLKLISPSVYTQIFYGDMTLSNATTCGPNYEDFLRQFSGSYGGTLIESDFAIKDSPPLQEGQTSYTWKSNTSNYLPQPGHKYCIFIAQSDEARTTSKVVSNLVQVQTKLYNLTAISSTDSITLNWTPGLTLISPSVYTQIFYGDMTAANTQECSNTNTALTGSYAGTLIESDFAIKDSPPLQEGQTQYVWRSNTSNYIPVLGHRYCLFISQSNESRTSSKVVSNFLQVVMSPQ